MPEYTYPTLPDASLADSRRAYSLIDGDLISLGRLHFQLKIVRQPEVLTIV